ncbi:DUF6879 family protein [Asanoa siamensis]|uniref:DUF6879 domain-containing protein n=1 Tax=Asanoa siamensis TaxID=926357 RepID=A0ABQ4CS67_9ACTN|nr:DUF6879 family protein [Asanoa siamensis]GIF74143.1 hypothetical protein Asi02nite_36610 [Asanoa siamensis]
MQMDELERLLRSVERSVFRLETLNAYNAPGETELFGAFIAGHPLPRRHPDTDPWLRMVADSVSASRHWSRVHLLDRPLSDYLRFELLGYHGNVAAGEEVWIAERPATPSRLAELTHDFWLLDETQAIVVDYDESGRRVAMEPATDTSLFIDQRDLALASATPLAEYLPTVLEELRRSW